MTLPHVLYRAALLACCCFGVLAPLALANLGIRIPEYLSHGLGLALGIATLAAWLWVISGQ